MLRGIRRQLSLLLVIGLFVQFGLTNTVFSATEGSIQVVDLNFVFLHGMGGTPCSFQLLSDYITERLPVYALRYEKNNPNTKETINSCFAIKSNLDKYFFIFSSLKSISAINAKQFGYIFCSSAIFLYFL